MSHLDLVEDGVGSDSHDDIPALLQQSPYYDNDSFIQLMANKKGKITLLSLNCQSLNAKIDQLRIFLECLIYVSCSIDIICLQESWLHETADVSHLQLEGYTLISRGKSCSAHGGVVIYLSKKFTFHILPFQSNSNSWDGLFIEVKSKNSKSPENDKKIVVGNIYRPPRNLTANYTIFNDELNEILTQLQRTRHEVLITGDFNIDLLKLNEKSFIHDYFEIIMSNGFVPRITLPTRFGEGNSNTLIDNIFVKLSDRLSETTAGILLHHISDHQPYFICLDKFSTEEYNKDRYVSIRKISQQSMNNFTQEVANRCILDRFDTDISRDPNLNYDMLNNIISEALMKHLPTKTVKFKKYIHRKTKWITPGIMHSIKVRDRLYIEIKRTDVYDAEYKTKKQNLQNYTICNSTLTLITIYTVLFNKDYNPIVTVAWSQFAGWDCGKLH